MKEIMPYENENLFFKIKLFFVNLFKKEDLSEIKQAVRDFEKEEDLKFDKENEKQVNIDNLEESMSEEELELRR